MPHGDPPSTGMVMIEDENGVKQPWSIIPHPDTIPKNCSVRKLMELGSDSDSDPGSDNDDNDNTDDKTAKAQKAIYRSICARALRGKLKWKNITSEQRNAVRQEALENNPYLRRFEGAWLEELIMQRQLRHSRDTTTRKENKKKALKSRVQDKKKSHSPQDGQVATPTAPAQNNIGTSSRSVDSTKDNTLQHTSKKRTGPGQQIQRPSTTKGASTEGEGPISNREPPAPMDPNLGKRQNTLLTYFTAKPSPQPAPTTNTKHLGASGSSSNTQVNDDSSGSDDEGWSRGVDNEIANLKSKKQNVASAPSSTAKKGNTTPESSTATTSRSRSRPKMVPPPTAGANERTATEVFTRTTRAGKQETIDRVEEEMDGASKAKAAKKGKKNTNGKQKGKK
ncbi:hypothetical protein FRC11_000160 [Ceratobasidium sp. 423]|nr:hypothetical protein FRC11_000160 [Ceratobasidium sp. 423]